MSYAVPSNSEILSFQIMTVTIMAWYKFKFKMAIALLVKPTEN